MHRPVRPAESAIGRPDPGVPVALAGLLMPNACHPPPIHGSIAGVEVVTIPIWHYAELLECQRTVQLNGLRASQIRAHPAILAADPRSRLFADPEVCIFLYEICGRMKLPDAYSACCERFGMDRSPSRATIGRYWQRVRRGS